MTYSVLPKINISYSYNASTSELSLNLEEMFPRYCIHSDIVSNSVLPVSKD